MICTILVHDGVGAFEPALVDDDPQRIFTFFTENNYRVYRLPKSYIYRSERYFNSDPIFPVGLASTLQTVS